MFTHVFISPTTQYGTQLLNGLAQFESGLSKVIQYRDTMTRMIDGDGSDPAMFSEVTSRFGIPDNASSKAVWDELNSVLAKLTTDASVSNVQSALAQAFSKFR